MFRIPGVLPAETVIDQIVEHITGPTYKCAEKESVLYMKEVRQKKKSTKKYKAMKGAGRRKNEVKQELVGPQLWGGGVASAKSTAVSSVQRKEDERKKVKDNIMLCCMTLGPVRLTLVQKHRTTPPQKRGDSEGKKK